MSLILDFAWGLLLLPLPWLARYLPPARLQAAALWVPFFEALAAGRHDTPPIARPRRRAYAAWLLLVLALARPVLTLEDGSIELYRPLLFAALLLALHLGLALTRRPRVYRRLPAHYHREGE